MSEKFTIDAAKESDLAAVLELLTETQLPHDGVADYLNEFIVARDEAGNLVGCAGIERHGDSGLLRSVAVSPSLQKSGLGSRLTDLVLIRAKEIGIDEIVLLTTTAGTFFARRFGFVEAKRADFQEQFVASPEWHLPRCSSAMVMKLNLRNFK